MARSIYKDKEVFIRELISNSSDALEKQRYAVLRGEAGDSGDDLFINIDLNESERTITIFVSHYFTFITGLWNWNDT